MLVTSGPTHEPIDPVRYIANRSSGKQGHAIAAAAARAGAEVTLVSGPVNLPDPPGVTVDPCRKRARHAARRSKARCPPISPSSPPRSPTGASANAGEQKIKKKPAQATPELSLTENPDILSTIAHRKAQRPRLVIGFAAETENVAANAKEKLARKGCDWILANDVSPQTGIMGGDTQHHRTRHRRRRRALAAAVEGRCGRDADRAGVRGAGEAMSHDSMFSITRLPHGHDLPLPSYQSALAAGLDLIAAVPADAPLTLAPGARALVPTGIAIALPAGTEAQVRPRSGLAVRHGLTVLNAPGTIDADYRGEIQVLLVNLGAEAVTIARGMRIAQLVIATVARASCARSRRSSKRRAGRADLALPEVESDLLYVFRLDGWATVAYYQPL